VRGFIIELAPMGIILLVLSLRMYHFFGNTMLTQWSFSRQPLIFQTFTTFATSPKERRKINLVGSVKAGNEQICRIVREIGCLITDDVLYSSEEVRSGRQELDGAISASSGLCRHPEGALAIHTVRRSPVKRLVIPFAVVESKIPA